jgi:hypothetical protein
VFDVHLMDGQAILAELIDPADKFRSLGKWLQCHDSGLGRNIQGAEAFWSMHARNRAKLLTNRLARGACAISGKWCKFAVKSSP